MLEIKIVAGFLWSSIKKMCVWSWGPGLVVMGGDSCSRGPEFESQHCILDEHLFILICCKHCIDV